MNEKLKLEVLLAGIDKLTAPLKSITGGTNQTAKSLKAARDELNALNQAQNRIDGWRKLDKDLAIVGNTMASTQDKIKVLRLEMALMEAPTKDQLRYMKQLQHEAGTLKTRHNDLIERQQRLRTTMAGAGMDTKNLAAYQVELRGKLDQATAAVNRQTDALRKENAQQRQLHALQAQRDKHMAMRSQVANAGAKTLAGGAVVGAATAVPIVAYAKAEDSATQLRVAMMQQGGKVAADFEKINQLATQLGNRLPGTTSDFQDMMTMLIRQGMPAKALLGGLGEATAYLAVQLKMAPTDAAEFASKLQDATRTTDRDMMGLMDTIQRTFYLGVDSNNMLNAFAKLSPALSVLKMEGLEASKALAPLLVMADQAGMAGESAGNAYRKVFQLAMDTDKVSKGNALLNGTGVKLEFTDGKGEFGGMDQMFKQLAQLKNVNTAQRLAALKKIFGDDAETLQALTLMIEKGADGYAQVQAKMANQADIQERVNAQLGTLKSLWEAASGTFTNLLVAFGEAIAPELKALTTWIGDVTARAQAWAQANPQLANTLMKVAAFTAILLTGVGALMAGVAAIAGPFILFKYALGAIGVAAPAAGSGILSLLNPVAKVIAAFTAGYAAGTLLNNGINWLVSSILGYETTLGGAVFDMVENIKTRFGEAVAFVTGLPAQFMAAGSQMIDGMIAGILARWESLKQTVASIAGGAVTAAKEALGIHSPSRVFAELGGYTMEGLALGIEQGQGGPLGAVSKAAKALAGAGAGLMIGGTAMAGDMPLLDKSPAMSRPSAAVESAAPAQYIFNIYPPAGVDAQEVARLVRQEIQAAEAQRAARSRSSLMDRE